MSKPANLRSHLSKLFKHKVTSFQHRPYPRPATPIVATLFYMYWLDKRGHCMWCYFTCKHVSSFYTPHIICMFFAKFIYNVYIRPYFFFRMLFLRISLVLPPPPPPAGGVSRSHGKMPMLYAWTSNGSLVVSLVTTVSEQSSWNAPCSSTSHMWADSWRREE